MREKAEPVLVLYDDTVLGTGENGVVLTLWGDAKPAG